MEEITPIKPISPKVLESHFRKSEGIKNIAYSQIPSDILKKIETNEPLSEDECKQVDLDTLIKVTKLIKEQTNLQESLVRLAKAMQGPRKAIQKAPQSIYDIEVG